MTSSIEANLDGWLESMRYMRKFQKLFLTGSPKSGTTWLQKLLNGHPQVVAEGEGRFAWSLFPLMQKAIVAFNQDQKKYGGSEHGMIADAEFGLMLRSVADNVFLRYLAASGKALEIGRASCRERG